LHGLAKGLIVLDDRYQCTFRHSFSTSFAKWFAPKCTP
jgi:hypothetical protein